jgi:hypothetical protein
MAEAQNNEYPFGAYKVWLLEVCPFFFFVIAKFLFLGWVEAIRLFLLRCEEKIQHGTV